MTLRLREEDSGTRQLLMLTCGGLEFALPAETVRAIAGEHGEPAAETLDALGVGSPVMEFGDLFGVQSHPMSTDSRVIVCGTTETSRAFRVDRLSGLQELPHADFRPLPPHFSGPERQWFGGLYLHGDRIALLVNPGWLIGCEVVATGPVAVRDITPLPVADRPSEPPPAPPSGGDASSVARQVVTVNDDMFGVIELEEAHDAEGLPWAPL